jgi:hypothetical protein
MLRHTVGVIVSSGIFLVATNSVAVLLMIMMMRHVQLVTEAVSEKTFVQSQTGFRKTRHSVSLVKSFF